VVARNRSGFDDLTLEGSIFAGGIECALDIFKAYSHGAGYVIAGRAWHYAAGALGQRGMKYLSGLLARDLEADLRQIGAPCVADLKYKCQQGAVVMKVLFGGSSETLKVQDAV
jgi:isopentenyl diphosphate isomerase/L-lactate dehydrogenase-like FMN-dependent dehydrogenase